MFDGVLLSEWWVAGKEARMETVRGGGGASQGAHRLTLGS